MKNSLLVFEFNGTPRAGKGSIVRELGRRHGFANTETGANYRTITRYLLRDDHIKTSHSSDEVAAVIAELSDEQIKRYVCGREAIEAELGADSLYQQDINQTVHLVAAIERVRKQVKTQFKAEVEAAVANPEVRVLAIDGRNLAPVIRSVAKADLGLRMFITCTPKEAALREVERGSISSEQVEDMANEMSTRMDTDARRELDPVTADADAIDYWKSGQQSSDSFLRLGVGTEALSANRQIILDTTRSRDVAPDDPRQAMIDIVDQIVDEVLA